MSGAASEHQALLASFAEEIDPLLAMLAGALDRLVERPADATAVTVGRAQVQTLQGAASMLDLTGFIALLDLVREAPPPPPPPRPPGAALAESRAGPAQRRPRPPPDHGGGGPRHSTRCRGR